MQTPQMLYKQTDATSKSFCVMCEQENLCYSEAQQQGIVHSLAGALQQLLALKRSSTQPNSPGHRVLSAGLKATCVLLLPPHFSHGSGQFRHHSLSGMAAVVVVLHLPFLQVLLFVQYPVDCFSRTYNMMSMLSPC